MTLPTGWTEANFSDLYDLFSREVELAIDEAQREGLRVVRVSGARGYATQKRLRDIYEFLRDLRALLQANKTAEVQILLDRANLAGLSSVVTCKIALARAPLPAAKPGGSAHNFVLCLANPVEHKVMGTATCPVCGSGVVPASLALDVRLVDAAGNPIPSGGALKLELRPPEWQTWAHVLKNHPDIRDGGTFSTPDPVHCEWARWDVGTRWLHV